MKKLLISLCAAMMTVMLSISAFSQNGEKKSATIVRSSNMVVKGAPFTGTVMTSQFQPLMDGNKILRETKTSIFRDSEGRFRSEESTGTFGGYFDINETVTISDPVGGFQYFVNPVAKSVRRLNLKTASDLRILDTLAVYKTPTTFKYQGYTPKTEDLGSRLIEGLEVTGTRTSITFEAGKIGNERPLTITSDVWYSKDLQLNLLIKRTDPRDGEYTYSITNIKRGDPDKELFIVPANYKIDDQSKPNQNIKDFFMK